jgi:hypothetical protein
MTPMLLENVACEIVWLRVACDRLAASDGLTRTVDVWGCSRTVFRCGGLVVTSSFRSSPLNVVSTVIELARAVNAWDVGNPLLPEP